MSALLPDDCDNRSSYRLDTWQRPPTVSRYPFYKSTIYNTIYRLKTKWSGAARRPRRSIFYVVRLAQWAALLFRPLQRGIMFPLSVFSLKGNIFGVTLCAAAGMWRVTYPAFRPLSEHCRMRGKHLPDALTQFFPTRFSKNISDSESGSPV